MLDGLRKICKFVQTFVTYCMTQACFQKIYHIALYTEQKLFNDLILSMEAYQNSTNQAQNPYIRRVLRKECKS